MTDKTPPPYTAIYPVEVSLVQEGGRYLFITNDTVPVYVYDMDSPGKSNCDAACAKVWFPVVAPTPNKVLGDWKAIQRQDKTWQWSYKGRPVYTNVHDQPTGTIGKGSEGGPWHILIP